MASCILQRAEEQLAAHHLEACLALLHNLNNDKGEDLHQEDERKKRQLQAICVILRAAKDGDWNQVFGLKLDQHSTQDLKRQVRKLTLLVHPDKCSVPASSDAFKELLKGAKVMECKLENNKQIPRRKRRKLDPNEEQTNHRQGGEEEDNDSCFQQKGEFSELEEQDDADFNTFGSSFPWWEEWDGDADLSIPPEENEEQLQEEKETAADVAALCQLSIPQLRNEVARRQGALLDRSIVDANGKLIPLEKLKAKLTRARSELSRRLDAEKQTVFGNDGGFLV